MSYRTAAENGARILDIKLEGVLTVCEAIEREIVADVIPGAVLSVVHRGKEWTYRTGLADPHASPPRPVCDNTGYDCASLTKVVVTLPLVLGLIDDGLLTLNTPVAVWLPEFAVAGKEAVTVGQLLTHTSGLPAGLNLHSQGWTNQQIWEAVYGVSLLNAPDTVMAYSDLGFMTLGRIVEQVLGMPLEDAARTRIFEPLGMNTAMFTPSLEQREFIAPTEYDRELDRHLWGEVHDENARALGGICGHAGLFANASDLVSYARMWLAGGLVHKVSDLSVDAADPSIVQRRVLSQDIVNMSIQSWTKGITGVNRGLGWALKGDPLDASGDCVSPRCYGHTGFTGTSLWIDPDHDLAVILLTNRVYYGRGGSIALLRATVHTALVSATR